MVKKKKIKPMVKKIEKEMYSRFSALENKTKQQQTAWAKRQRKLGKSVRLLGGSVYIKPKK